MVKPPLGRKESRGMGETKIFAGAFIRRGWVFWGLLFILMPVSSYGQNNGLAIGYGVGAFNPHERFGNIPNDERYEFLQVSYFHQFSLFKNGFFVLEPFVAYTYRNLYGTDVGLNLYLKYNFWNWNSSQNSLYAILGTGGVITNVNFTDQGSHGLVIGQAGAGFKWDRFFIEGRYRHYSNGGFAAPNTGVDAFIVNTGFYF